MRDDELRRILSEANPWWRAAAEGLDPAGWVSTHRLLRDRSKYDLGYRSTVLSDIARGPLADDLVLLTGPRRVGKTVVLIDTIAALCARDDLDARQIIFLRCDGMTARDLRRAITLGRELTKAIDRVSTHRRVWLLDEVGSISGWTSIVKTAREDNSMGDDTVIATSSRWQANEDVEGNLMAGRAGSSSSRRIRLLHPMSFRSFLAATSPELPRLHRTHPSFLRTPEVATQLERLRHRLDDFDLAWQAYLTCGGFPRAVSEFHTEGMVSRAYVQDLAAWLRQDVDPDLPPESIALLLAALSERSTSPFNVKVSSEQLGLTKGILARRLQRLASSFAVAWCQQRNDRGAIVAGASAKLYLTDPVLAWLPSVLRSGIAPPDMTRLTEMSIGVALSRAIDRLDEGRWVARDTIGFATTGSGNEVDFAPVPVPTPSGSEMTTPLESKWVDDGWRGDARVLFGKYREGILATKSILDTESGVWAVPAPLLALLLE
jgi:hypothetical protein